MPEDPCIMYVKQAKKNIGLFRKNYWTAGLYFLQAAECYKNSGNKSRAYEYAKEAVKCLDKYWSGTNDMVLPDLEKALSLAYYMAPKKRRKEMGRKAFEVYIYHARRLENAGNYLAAAEKYEASAQFAPSGSAAREAILKAISVLENALQKEHIIKKRDLVERIEKKLEELKKMAPPPKEASHPGVVETRLRYVADLEVFSAAMNEVVSSFHMEFPLPISDPKVVKRGEKNSIQFSIPGYSALVIIECRRKSCLVEVNSSNITFILEIVAILKYYLDKKEALSSVVNEKILGKYKAIELMDYINKVLHSLKIKDEARKIAFYIDTLSFILSQFKRLSKICEDLKSYALELLDLYVPGKEIMPVDAERVESKVKELLKQLKK